MKDVFVGFKGWRKAVFQKCLNQEFSRLTSGICTVFINFLPLTPYSGPICAQFVVMFCYLLMSSHLQSWQAFVSQPSRCHQLAQGMGFVHKFLCYPGDNEMQTGARFLRSPCVSLALGRLPDSTMWVAPTNHCRQAKRCWWCSYLAGELLPLDVLMIEQSPPLRHVFTRPSCY